MPKPHNAIDHRSRLLLGATVLAAITLLVASAFIAPARTSAQSQTLATDNMPPAYEFEAASIKLNKSGTTGFVAGFTADGYRAKSETLIVLLIQAYGVRPYQISGTSAWANSDHYDVEAKMEASVADALNKLTPDQLKLARQKMLQALVADRFSLKVRRETKEGPVYFLVIGKNGPKLQDSKPADDDHQLLGPDGGGIHGFMTINRGTGGDTKRTASEVSMPYLATVLSQELRRPVLDKTGLTGTYDFTLEWMPDRATAPGDISNDENALPGDPGASIFTAIQQQLGLKLEPGSGPVETLVIDHVERPSAN
jgi:uncharacterized protein (TIGR03435 family)